MSVRCSAGHPSRSPWGISCLVHFSMAMAPVPVRVALSGCDLRWLEFGTDARQEIPSQQREEPGGGKGHSDRACRLQIQGAIYSVNIPLLLAQRLKRSQCPPEHLSRTESRAHAPSTVYASLDCHDEWAALPEESLYHPLPLCHELSPNSWHQGDSSVRESIPHRVQYSALRSNNAMMRLKFLVGTGKRYA